MSAISLNVCFIRNIFLYKKLKGPNQKISHGIVVAGFIDIATVDTVACVDIVAGVDNIADAVDIVSDIVVLFLIL